MDAQTTHLDHREAGPSDAHDDAITGNTIVKEAQRHKLLTAAIVGGAMAAGAGAFLGTRALARRNGANKGQPLSSVMETAITACNVNGTQAAKADA